jgi:hypothetical protein
VQRALESLATDTAKYRLQLQKVEEKQARAHNELAVKLKVSAEQRKKLDKAKKDTDEVEGLVQDPGQVCVTTLISLHAFILFICVWMCICVIETSS